MFVDARTSERNLGGWSDFDGVLSRGEAVEDEIVVGDDLRGGEDWRVTSQVSVTDQSHVVSHRDCAAASCIYTIFGHAADDGKVFRFRSSEVLVRIRFRRKNLKISF